MAGWYYNINYHNHEIDYDDLYQECLIGLYYAAENFDKTRGVYFCYYLNRVMKNCVMTYCRDYLPHYYKLDPEKSLELGHDYFTHINIVLESWDEHWENDYKYREEGMKKAP